VDLLCKFNYAFNVVADIIHPNAGRQGRFPYKWQFMIIRHLRADNIRHY
jgi:hypothetical protein